MADEKSVVKHSAREFAEAITNGKIKGTAFNGRRTYESIRQALFALRTRYNPDGWIGKNGTYIDPKLKAWEKDLAGIMDAVTELSPELQQKLNKQIDEMLKPNE